MEHSLLLSFVTVAKSGSISAAARRLGLSQSALSRRLMQLRDELGFELLSPSGRGVILTEAGRYYAEGASDLLERHSRLRREIEDQLSQGAATVRVGGGATAVASLLPDAMARFRKDHPKVRFHLEEAGSREVAEAVLGERIDLGVVTLPVQSRDLVVTPLLKDRIVLVASQDHPLARKKGITKADLNGQPLIGFEAGSAIRRLIDDALSGARVELNVVMEVRSVAAILRLVESTGSLAFVSEMGTSGQAVLPVKGLKVERQLGLVTKRGRTVSRASLSFAELLLERAGANGRSSGKKPAH